MGLQRFERHVDGVPLRLESLALWHRRNTSMHVQLGASHVDLERERLHLLPQRIVHGRLHSDLRGWTNYFTVCFPKVASKNYKQTV